MYDIYGAYNRVYTYECIRYAARLTSNGCETRINEF